MPPLPHCYCPGKECGMDQSRIRPEGSGQQAEGTTGGLSQNIEQKNGWTEVKLREKKREPGRWGGHLQAWQSCSS